MNTRLEEVKEAQRILYKIIEEYGPDYSPDFNQAMNTVSSLLRYIEEDLEEKENNK